MLDELEHIKNNEYEQKFWNSHNNQTNILLSKLSRQSKVASLSDKAISILTDYNVMRQKAEDFTLLTDTYRNKTLKMLTKSKDTKDRVGPSLKFKQAMLDKFLKMIEETASKMKSKSVVNYIKQRREREQKYSQWYIKRELKEKNLPQ